jgi:dTDP-4-dehydrorhamnose 3,5-epimerase-like enzyme
MISSPTVSLIIPQLGCRGDMTELIRDEDLPLCGGVSNEEGKITVTPPQPKFGQAFITHFNQIGTTRAFFQRQHCWDFFIVLQGKLHFWCVSPDEKTAFNYILAGRVYSRLCIPPMWFRGWQNLVEDTTCLSVHSHVYNPDAPDEEKVPLDHFAHLGVQWSVKPLPVSNSDVV